MTGSVQETVWNTCRLQTADLRMQTCRLQTCILFENMRMQTTDMNNIGKRGAAFIGRTFGRLELHLCIILLFRCGDCSAILKLVSPVTLVLKLKLPLI